MRLINNQLWSVFLTVFAVSLIFTAGFITGCGDEGDNVDSMTDMVVGGDDMDKDEEPTDPDPDPPVDPLPTVSYKDDIEPILNESCALGGCHVGGGASAGLDLSSYDTFKTGGAGGAVFTVNDGENSRVVQLIHDGSMPLGGTPLTGEQIQLFIDWIDEGAENN